MYEITVEVEGMMCSMCESHVNDVIRNAFAVKKVSSSHQKGQTVILSERQIPEQEIKQTIEKLGYRVDFVHERPAPEKKRFFSRCK